MLQCLAGSLEAINWTAGASEIIGGVAEAINGTVGAAEIIGGVADTQRGGWIGYTATRYTVAAQAIQFLQRLCSCWIHSCSTGFAIAALDTQFLLRLHMFFQNVQLAVDDRKCSRRLDKEI